MSSFACNSFNSVKLTRRSALQIGGAGLLGLNLPRLFAAEDKRAASAPPVRAKSVIFLFQFGGPSHIDMFDMKPDAPDGIRGPYKPIASASPEIQVCERLPEVAKVMDKVTLIRSMTPTAARSVVGRLCTAASGRPTSRKPACRQSRIADDE